MQQLTNRSRAVIDKKMTFSERIYLPAILGGMWITLKHFFRKPATSQYPEQVRSRSEVYRGQHVLKRDEQGKERCTACGLCAVACPAEAITMVAAEREKGEEHLYREEKYAAKYEINMLRCIFCGLCIEACPTRALTMTNEFELADTTRSKLIFEKEDLLAPLRQGMLQPPHPLANGATKDDYYKNRVTGVNEVKND